MKDAPPTPAELERELERLPEVRAARVVTSPAGRILEVHLVTDGSKPPKQLTRDVETVVVTLGLDIDRRTISIAQMPEGTVPETKTAPGIVLSSLAVTTEGTQVTCRVRVSCADEEAIGEASGNAAPTRRPHLVARATVSAVASLSGIDLDGECDSVRIVESGDHRVAVVTVASANGIAHVGSALVRSNEDDAVAHAVLDAIGKLSNE